jgi:hypothetical protein
MPSYKVSLDLLEFAKQFSPNYQACIFLSTHFALTMITGLIIGSGRQSEVVINYLSVTNKYHLLVFTRSITSHIASRLATLPNVELVANVEDNGYNLQAYEDAAKRSDFVFINTDGFALGEQAETYWGIRLFELAKRADVKHVIYSGLDYNGKESGYDPELYVGHYEGKARVQGNSTN